MRYRVKVKVPVEKRGFLGSRKTVMETRIIEVDRKTYKEMKKREKQKPYTLEEMMLYDELMGDE
ncbi:MAG: hypothetical protein IJ246_03725 [Clostridia bacterium]|nr:hypothetical protein [Clostridia bacterium]